MIEAAEARRFILDNTSILSPPHVPELRLHLADEAHDLWHRTEEQLGEIGLPPPFWAFAWAGGQGLARYVLDNPQILAGKHVLDFASGSGLVGIAAMMAGAKSVTCADVDPFSAEAAGLNAKLNNAELSVVTGDLVGSEIAADILLAGDVFYDREFAERLIPWFETLAASGTKVLIGDPGRSYVPKNRLAKLASHDVPVTRALEEAEVKHTTIWRYGP